MNKRAMIIAAVVLGVLVLGGATYALVGSNNSNEQDKMAMEKAVMEKKDDAAMEKKDGESMEKDAMSKHGSYVTLADYNADQNKYADSKKVYFFHASWCPICQGIDEEINEDMSKIPVGTVFIKTDFDSETALRQKYGVTTQYTFVQVDNSGNETAQWSATSLDKAVAGIKS